MAELNGKQGVWRTIGGRRIFIVNGQDLPSAMKLSGKFGKKDTLQELKDLIGDYGQTLRKDNDMRYENGKLIRLSKVGEITEPDRAVRNAGKYKIFARHFSSNLPYTHYFIANTETGEVFSIPEIVTDWNTGVLKEITENIINGGPPKPKEYDFDPLDWKDIL